MPSAFHPQAKFDPIPPDLDLGALVENTPNFDYVVRIAAEQIHELGLEQFEKLVLLHVIVGGKPLVVEGWNQNLPPWLFSQTWLEDNVGKRREQVRDIVNAVDIPMTIGHYLGAMEKLTRQWAPANYRDPKRQRLYLKDIDCPEHWHQHLQNIIPQTLFYLNDCVGEQGGPGASRERNIYNQLVLGKGVGPAGDLMSNLPTEMRAENIMCYVGHEGTYTPAHREMCASLGQNIMVETSATEEGEKAGSSIWFMTESKDREVVSEYFLSMLGHDIEVESHFAQINAWKKAPFPVYIVDQKAGDFILIPPLAPHQVWNRGTRTIKVAWNRTTVETLELALHEALPRARMVCRDEQYKNKAIVYYSLLRYYDQLKRVEQAEDASWDGQVKDAIRNSIRVKQLKKDFKRLFALFTEILVGEMFSKDLPKEKHVEFLPFDSNVTCSYCRCNIFNRFLTCKTCIGEVEGTEEEDTYDICMECYAMGRSCGCVSNLIWVEQWPWHVLTQRYYEWRAMVIANAGLVDSSSSPQTLAVTRSLFGKKPVAQICQEQLKRRPWRDISKPFEPELSPESEPELKVDDEGRVKKRKGSRRKSRKVQNKACHICQHREWNWKLAFCTTCANSYCYGTLWRAFDMKPQTVMEDLNWKCPKCLNMCSCARCRRDPTQQAYHPKGTLLGHDTRRVADPRSVESLVDFSRTNLTWLRGEGDGDPHTSLRMQKLMEKAQTEKAREESLEEDILIEQGVGQEDVQNSPDVNPSNGMAIDPQLCDHISETIHGVDSKIDPDFGADSTMAYTQGAFLESQDKVSMASELQASVNGVPTHSQGQENSSVILDSLTNRVNQDANSLDSGSFYLDPLGSGRDRMMGMGYYQQANDADKILFEHPNPSRQSTPSRVESDFNYPRLPEEILNVNCTGKKRKIDSIPTSNNNEIESAHLQYLQAQKKQKLVDARRSGRYYMTLNKLEGSRSRRLIVKMSMTGSKEFLRNLQELDEGQKGLRHNPRSLRRSVARQHFICQVDGPAITENNKQGSIVAGKYQEDSDGQDDSIIPTALPVRVVGLIPNVDLGENIEGSGKMYCLKQKSVSERDKLSSDIEDSSCLPRAVSPPIQNLEKNQSCSDFTEKRREDQQQASQPLSSHVQKSPDFPVSKVCKPSTLVEVVTVKSLDSATATKQDKAVKVTFAKELITVSKTNVRVDDGKSSFKDKITVSTAKTSTTFPIPSKSKPLSEDYLRAKEEAFRMFEAELDEEEAARISSQKFTPVKRHISQPTKAGGPLGKKMASAVVKKSVPLGPPGQLMSMAQRQALKGRPFKIVAAKSNVTSTFKHQSKKAMSISKAKPIKSQQTLGYRLSSEDSDRGGPSSDSDSESIPAVRSIAPKPHIGALTSHNGNIKTSLKSAPGMLDDVRKVDRPVRLVN